MKLRKLKTEISKLTQQYKISKQKIKKLKIDDKNENLKNKQL